MILLDKSCTFSPSLQICIAKVGVAAMEPLAIIGMASRFPQDGDNNENFWKMLMTGKSAMTPFPKNRFDMDGHYHPDVEHGGTVSVYDECLFNMFTHIMDSFMYKAAIS